jgi:hypothetical protein
VPVHFLAQVVRHPICKAALYIIEAVAQGLLKRVECARKIHGLRNIEQGKGGDIMFSVKAIETKPAPAPTNSVNPAKC